MAGGDSDVEDESELITKESVEFTQAVHDLKEMNISKKQMMYLTSQNLQ
eukprot:CAMPEP_0170559380 /NCGR_PEP_ID=MMETSP0211-20121228/42330_1 /TAXON_ID=311385 /ORGANISM="Pseudokeronopsis sp., Strain OXSARD2" /LENGTH=48 /DNA_ID= /DNA_START= /DNA_END= /DNA_ORIENTATION=